MVVEEVVSHRYLFGLIGFKSISSQVFMDPHSAVKVELLPLSKDDHDIIRIRNNRVNAQWYHTWRGHDLPVSDVKASAVKVTLYDMSVEKAL